MRWSLRNTSAAILLAGTVGVLACNETPVSLPTATSVVVSATTLSLPVGGFQTVSGQVLDSNGEVIVLAAVLWSSDNEAVATISAAGLVTALDVGSATVTATHGALTATIAVTVTTVPATAGIISQIDILGTATEVDIAAGAGVLATFSALDLNGTELCLLGTAGIAVALRFDAGVLGGATGLAGGCRILIAPGAQAASTWLYLESGTAVDSIFVDVTNYGFNASFTGVPAAAAHVAGATVSYTVTIADKNGNPVVGQAVQFDVSQGSTVAGTPAPAPGSRASVPATSLTTDASGRVAVDWTLPQSTTSPPGVAPPELTVVAQLPAGVALAAPAGAPAVLPGPAASLVVVDITRGIDPGDFETLPSPGTAQTPLGGPLAPTFLVQSLDQFGNELAATNVSFQADAAVLSLIAPLADPVCGGAPDPCADLGAPVSFALAPLATGTIGMTVVEGAASSVVNVTASLGPVGGVRTRG